MGVAVRRYIDILIILTYPYSTYISSFFAAASLLIKNKFLLVYVIFVQYSKRCSKNISTRMYINCSHVSPEISTCEVPCDVSRKLQLILCAIMALYR